MNDQPTLAERDVRAILALLGETSAHPGDFAEKKRHLMNGLCCLIDADAWVWGLARDVEPGEPSVHLSLLHGGFSEKTYAMFTRAYLHPDMTAIHLPFVIELKRQRSHLTRLRQQIDPDRKSWTNGAGPFWEKADIHGVIMSMVPTGGRFLNAIGLYRKLEAPLFSTRDNRIAHIVLAAVPWLHRQGTDVESCDPLVGMSPRERMTLDLLVQGYTRARIAAHLEISPHTANEYVKSVFRQFRVHSQTALIGKFRKGDGRDLPAI